MTKQKKITSRGEKNTYYRVKDDCKSPMVFEDLDGALEYLKSCLEGIDDEFPVSIEKIQMTANQFNELPEL